MSVTGEYSSDGFIVLDKPVDLPEVLDLLIVGGGPGGSTVAFRAKELGLNFLVIDQDEIMKRIRDYPKDKPILPNFGGGDKLKFPKCGELVDKLHFATIDKDDMYKLWKRLYQECNIPAQIRIELTGLELQSDGVWEAKTWNHNVKKSQSYKAKHVVLAIGRGVPRRFDIPGNTDGIAFRLDDPASYVGKPTCVIGGGTSAGEAVIAISNAKTKAGDESMVFWSYRGDKMPRVSKALADVFFDVYFGNGNVRYYPKSDPAAIVTAEDKKEYLSIRVDRRCIEGRPNETSSVEFAKEFCVACIGEDIPEKFLKELGVNMPVGGAQNKKRMAVSVLLQTELENIYFVGDILSQAYFETDDFSADPSGFKEVKHRGNIKSAMRDGVYVAEVVAQKLSGAKEVRVVITDADTVVDQKLEAPVAVAQPVESEGPPPASVTKDRSVETPGKAWLVRILPGDIEEDEFQVKEHGVTTIGKSECDITLADDTMLSDKHASILHSEDGYFLRDDGSVNGVYLKAPEGKHLEAEPGNLVRAGRQFLVFAKTNGSFSFTHYNQSGKEIGKHAIPEKTILLGRDAPDIILDKQDGQLSRRHLALSIKDGKIQIKDLKSVNGTYLKVRNAIKINHGDRFRLAQQTFVFTLKEDAVIDPGHITIAPVPLVAPTPKTEEAPTPAPAPAPAVSATAEGGLTVTFGEGGPSFPIQPGQTICDIAEDQELTINAECHAGICGSDPIKIISGAENFNKMSDSEKEALEDICDLDPSTCRMACMAKPTGPVIVEIIKQ
ncbi:MAG: FHA domain-containing protein [candidate division Zixibacteria bacterium]|nr:FHA domain-containing protein [candidate division Zixibacteria bacterium]